MKNRSLKLKLLYGVLLPVMVVCIALSTVFTITTNLAARALPGGNSITLYENGEFIRGGYDELAVKLLGDGKNADDLLKAAEDKTVSAKKGYEFFGAGVDQTNTNAKVEWTVTLGDMEFMPAYLSYDNSGSLVLTLWQANGYGESVFNESYSQATSVSPRSNAYATSYIRTVALNNGGTYYTGYGNGKDAAAVSLETHTAKPSYSSPYMLFTLDETFSKYVVAPNQMPWVTTKQQGAVDYVNDYTNTTAGYENVAGYTAWAQDKVWLPSLNEIENIWHTTVNQNRSGGDSWLRSATTEANPESGDYNNNLAYAYRLTTAGDGMQDYVNTEYSVRAAINIDLTRMLHKVKTTAGYSYTNSDTQYGPGTFNALYTAWTTAIDKSLEVHTELTAEANTDADGYPTPNYSTLSLTYYREDFKNNESETVATAYYDTTRKAIVLKLFADWGAVKGPLDKYASFNGGLAKTTPAEGEAAVAADATTVENTYFYNGALYIAKDVNLVVDLNGHTINRNLYDADNVGNYAIDSANAIYNEDAEGWEYTCSYNEDTTYFHGQVIQIGKENYLTHGGMSVPGGTLTVTDTSARDEYSKVDENGIIGMGRITGGKHTYSPPSGYSAGQHEMGGGVRILAAREKESTDVYADEDGYTYHGRFILENGAICYNDARTGGGIGCPSLYTTTTIDGTTYSSGGKALVMTGGTISHNAGGGFRACWYTGYDEYLGGSIKYNTMHPAIQYEGGGSKPVFDGVEISHNTSGAVLLTNVEATEPTFNNCKINYNSSSGSNVTFANGYSWNTVNHAAVVTFNNCEFIGNTAGRGGLINLSLAGVPAADTKMKMTLNINGGTFANNSSSSEGGLIYMTKGTVNIDGNPVIRNNTAALGGGVIYMNNGVCNIASGQFINNTSGGDGGAIYIGDGEFNMTGGSFSGNSAKQINMYTYERSVTVKNAEGAETTTTSEFTSYKPDYISTTYKQIGEPVVIGGTAESPVKKYTYEKTVKDADGTVTTTTITTLYEINTLSITNKVTNTEVVGGIGGGVYMAAGNMYLETFAEGDKIQFIDNEGLTYPGFYAQSLTIKGDVEIADNKTSDIGKEQNIYLASTDATINISGALDGNIGITKAVAYGSKTTVANATAQSEYINYVYDGTEKVYIDFIYDNGVKYDIYKDTTGKIYYKKGNVYYQYVTVTDKDTNTSTKELQPIVVSRTLTPVPIVGKRYSVYNGGYYKNGDTYYQFTADETTPSVKRLTAVDTEKVDVTTLTMQYYEIVTDDLLNVHCDAGENYLFTVDKNVTNNTTYVTLSEKLQHKHSWATHSVTPTCTEQGYNTYVCTGCKEIYDGSTEHQTNTSGASIKPWEDTQIAGSIVYVAPKGHTYAWDDTEGAFVCSVCGDKVYIEIDDIPDQTYNKAEHKPAVSYKLYKLEEGNKVYISAALINNAPEATYSNNVNVGSNATATLDFAAANSSVKTEGTFIVPFGKNEGKPAVNKDGKTLTYSYNSTLPKAFDKTFKINTTEVSVRLENWQNDNLYIGDSSTYFAGISFFATIDGGNIDVSGNGEPKLMWKTSAEEKYSYVTPTLKVSEKDEKGDLIPVTYYWKWVSKNETNLASVEGTIAVAAKDYTLNEISVKEKNVSVIFDSYTSLQVKKMFTVTANMQSGQSTTVNRTLSENDYKLYLYDPDSKTEYDYLISGNYKFKFKYTYSGVEKEVITDKFYNVLTSYTKIEATLDDKPVYDSMTDIDGLREHLTVKGFKSGEAQGTEISGYFLEAQGKAWGSGAGDYAVNVCYGDKTAGKMVKIDVKVLANAVDKIEAAWSQTTTCNPNSNLAELNDYGELKVTVYYLDGTNKEIPMSVNGQAGYTLSGNIATIGTNKVTITYSEANALSGGTVSSASTTIDVITEPLAIDDLSYEPNGITLSADTTAAELNSGLVVSVIYTDGSKAQADSYSVSYCYFDEAASELVFAITAVKDSVSFEKHINHALPDEVTGITATVVGEAKANGLTLYDSLDHIKDTYIALTVNKSNNKPINYAAGNLPENVTLSLPSNQNGKFVVGNNTITVSYNVDGAVFSDKVTINFRAIELDLVEVTVNSVYGSGTEVEEGHIFTSSSLDDVRSMITVTGKYGDGSTTHIDVYGYDIGGVLTEGAQPWTITVTNKEGSAQKTFTVPITVNVTAVALTGVSAVYTQPEGAVIYENTPVSEIEKYVTVKAHYNDGNATTVYSGYEVTINANGTLHVVYNGTYQCDTAEAIKYSDATFDRIGVLSKQGNNVLYASVGEDDDGIDAYYTTVAGYLSVRKYMTDGSYVEIPYDATGAAGYTLSGSFKNGAKMYVNYKDADVEFTEEVTCLDVKPLIINSIAVDQPTINNFFVSYGLEALKNYLTVNATCNDGQVHVLKNDEYTLSGTLEAGKTCTITVSVGAGVEPRTFNVTPVAGTVTSVNRVESTQTDSDVIYASAELDDLKQYLTVYANVSGGTETPIKINSQDYSLIGSIETDGSYSIQVLINGEGMVPYTIPDKLLKITPIQPADGGLAVANSAASVLSSTKLKDFAANLTVSVTYNDSSKVALAYDETGANGYTLSGMLVAFDKEETCTVTVSYTLNGKTVEKAIDVKVVPLTSSLGVETKTNLPDIYYSDVFDGNGFNADSFGKVIDGYLDVYLENNGGASKTPIVDYTFDSAVYDANSGTATITVSTTLLATNNTATFTVPVIVVKPIELQVEKKGGVIYSTATNAEIKNALTVKELFNDDNTKAITDYTLSVKSGSVAIGGNVVFTVSYYDADYKVALKKDITIEVTKVVPTSISATYNGNKLYTISPEKDVRATLTVTLSYNHGPNKVVTDYEIDDYTLAAGNNTLTIRYNGLAEAATCTITGVVEKTVTEIKVTVKDSSKTVYTSNSLEDLRDNITVKAYENGAEICEIDAYTLSLYDESGVNAATWGAGKFTVRVAFNGKTADFKQTVVSYELETVELILDQTNFPIYDDYQLNNIKEGVKDNLKVSATWTDGYNHANEYTFTVTTDNIFATDDNNVLRIRYTYLKAGDTGSREAMVTINLTPTKVKEIKVTPNADYTLHTSDAVSSVADVATLTLIKNSGAEESVGWDTYICSFASEQWTTGGDEVPVTIKVTINGETFETTVNFKVNAVKLSQVTSVSYNQKGGDAGLLFNTSDANDILAAGELTVSGVNNDGSAVASVQILASMLEFNFESVQSGDAEVTIKFADGVTFAEGLNKFTVQISAAQCSGITAEVEAGVMVFYNADDATIKDSIIVTALYNNGDSKELSADQYSISEISKSESTYERKFTISPTEEGNNFTCDLTIKCEAPWTDCAGITVLYEQATELYAISGKEALLGNGNKLTVIAKYQTDKGIVEQSISTYSILNGASEFTTLVVDGGKVTLTVKYDYERLNGEKGSKTADFTVNVTAKAEAGIKAEYVAGETLYTSIKTKEVLEAKGKLTVKLVYNDGTVADTALNSADYTCDVNFANAGTGTITVKYGEFTTTCEVKDVVAPSIVSVRYEWKKVNNEIDNVVYVGDDISAVRDKLFVYGVYNDIYNGKPLTADRVLFAAQYNLYANTAKVSNGEVKFTIEYVNDTKIKATIGDVIIKQLIDADAATTLQYSKLIKDGETETWTEWADVTDNKLVEKNKYQLRLAFTAADGSGSTKYVKVDTSTFGENADSWVKGEYTLNLAYSTETDYIAADGLYVLDSALTVKLTLEEKKITGIKVDYKLADGATVYTTTTHEELVQDVTLEGKTITAKGSIAISFVYNDGEVTAVTEAAYNPDGGSGTYSLAGTLSAGTNTITVLYKWEINSIVETLYGSFTVNAVTPAIDANSLTASVNGGSISIVYGDPDGETKILNSLTVKGTYDDDHDTSFDIDKSNLTLSYAKAESETNADYDAIGVGNYSVYVAATVGGVNVTAQEATGTLTVTQRTIQIVVTANGGTYRSTITAPTISFTNKLDKDTVVPVVTYYADYTDGDENDTTKGTTTVPTEAGTYKVVVTIPDTAAAANANYVIGNAEAAKFDFVISPKEISDESIVAEITSTAEELIYTGTAKTPTFTLTDGENGLTVDVEYTVVGYENNINASSEESKAIIKVSGKGNYTGERNIEFTIGQAAIKWNIAPEITNAEIYISMPVSDITFNSYEAVNSNNIKVNGTVTITDVVPAVKGAATLNYTFTPDDTSYAPITGSFEVNVVPVKITIEERYTDGYILDGGARVPDEKPNKTGDVTVDYNEEKFDLTTYAITKHDGYEAVFMYEGNAVTELTSIKASCKVDVYYRPLSETYTIRFIKMEESGNYTSVDQLSLKKDYWKEVSVTAKTGDTVNLATVNGELDATFVPAEGFKFDKYCVGYDGEALNETNGTQLNGSGTTVIYVFYARYVHKVTLVTYGGTVDNWVDYVRNICYGADIPEIPAAKRDGYTFMGWYAKSNYEGDPISEGSIAASTMGTEDLTYYAKWEISNSKLTLYGNPYENGSPIINTTYYTFVVPSSLKNEPYTSAGDNTWSRTFTVNDAFALPTLTSNGYTFDGWYTEDGVRVTSITTGTTAGGDGIVLNAKWTAKKFSVTYDGNGGKFANGISKVFTMTTGTNYPTLLGEDEATKDAISKAGYKFDGWTLIKNGDVTVSGKAYLTGSTRLYAKWTPIPYTMRLSDDTSTYDGIGVSFKKNGVACQEGVDFTVSVGDIVTITVIAPNGYSVGGLKVGANNQSVVNGRTYTVRTTSAAAGSTEIIITPTLKAITYYITYSYPGASTTANWDEGSYPKTYTANDVDKTLHLPGYTEPNPDAQDTTVVYADVLSKAGYEFDGWLLDGEEFGASYAVSNLGNNYRNLTFVANWTAVAQPIIFDFNYLNVISADGNSVTVLDESFKFNAELETDSTFYLHNADYINPDGSGEIFINNLGGLYNEGNIGGIKRVNYEFIGWATSPLGAVVYPATYDAAGNMSISGSFTVKPGGNTFYAKWNVANVQYIIITAENNECTYDGTREVVLTPKPRYAYESDANIQLTYSWDKLVDGEWQPVNLTGVSGETLQSITFRANQQAEYAKYIQLHLKEVKDSGQYRCTLHVSAVDTSQSGTQITYSSGEGEQQVIINKGPIMQIEMKDQEVVYDGQSHTLQISYKPSIDETLTEEELAKLNEELAALLKKEGITVTYDASYINVGTYSIKATFTVPEESNFTQIDPIYATLTITPKELTDADIVWTSSVLNPDFVEGGTQPQYLFTKVYDGTPLTLGITVKGIEGDEITAVFDGQFESAVGTYTALITDLGGAQGGNYSLTGVKDKIKCEYSITKAIIDLSGITFEDAEVTYDGTLKTLTLSGDLPDYVTVVYTMQYDPNVAGVLTGDGTANNGGINAGVYRIVASFIINADVVDNYEPIDDMSAVLTITKADYTNITLGQFVDTTAKFDPNIDPVKPTIKDSGIFGVDYTYEQLQNNSYVAADSGFKTSGSYRATAKFAFKEGDNVNLNNYNLHEDEIITYIIEYPDVKSISATYSKGKSYKVGDEFDRTELVVTVTYVTDSLAKSTATTTLTSEEYELHFYNAETKGCGEMFKTFKKVGTTTLIVSYGEKTSETFDVTVAMGDFDVSKVTCTDVTVTYDGKYHLPEVADVPMGLAVYFTLNGDETNTKYYPAETLTAGAINAGEHNFTMHYELVDGYEADYNEVTKTLTAKVTINKKALSISFAINHNGTAFEGTPVYDGSAYSIDVTAEGFIGEEGTSRTFDLTNGSKTGAGTYITTVNSVLNGSDVDNNYALPAVKTYQWSIGKKEVSITFDNETKYTYNGEEQSVNVTVGDLIAADAGKVEAAVSYGGIGVKFQDAGNYNVRVTGLKGDAAANYKLPTSGLTSTCTIAPQEVFAVWHAVVSGGLLSEIKDSKPYELQYKNQSLFDRVVVKIKDGEGNFITANGEDVTLTLSSDKGGFTDVNKEGEVYVLTASYADTNYTVNSTTNTHEFRITATVSTVVWSYAIDDGDFVEMVADSDGVYSLPYIGKIYHIKAEYELLGGARQTLSVNEKQVESATNYKEGGYSLVATTNTNLGNNYTLGNDEITLNITKVVVKIDWPTEGFVFDGNEKTVDGRTLSIVDETVNGVQISKYITIGNLFDLQFSTDSILSATDAGDYTVKFRLTAKSGSTDELLANFELDKTCYTTHDAQYAYPYTYVWSIASTKFELKESSTLEIDRTGEEALLNNVTEAKTLAEIKAQFVGENLNVTAVNASGKALTDDSNVGTGTKITLMNGDKKIDEVTVVVKGDVNGDGKLNAIDAMNLKRAILKLDKPSTVVSSALDINGDGKVNAIDAMLLKRHILKLQSIFAANTPAPATYSAAPEVVAYGLTNVVTAEEVEAEEVAVIEEPKQVVTAECEPIEVTAIQEIEVIETVETENAAEETSVTEVTEVQTVNEPEEYALISKKTYAEEAILGKRYAA